MRQRGPEPETARELRRETLTMALYTAVCLLAALAALPRSEGVHSQALRLVWGVPLGLALAHWFAFRLSSRMVAAGRVGRHELASAAAQLTGAVAVAVLASVPVLLLPGESELGAVGLVLAAWIGAVGFGVARGAGATVLRSIAYAAVVLAVAFTIAIVKNALAGH